MGKNERLEWIDFAKGIGIFLVVVGHTNRGLVNSGILSNEGLNLLVDQWIYSFHMPLFFFISGLFIQNNKSLKDNILGKVHTIVYPYIIWSILFGSTQIILNKNINSQIHLIDLIKIPITPIGHFWFLYILFFSSLAYYLFNRMNLERRVILLIAIIIYLTQFTQLNFDWWFFSSFRYHFLFFALGIFLTRDTLRKIVNQLNRFTLTTITIFGYMMIVIIISLQITGAYLNSYNLSFLKACLGIFSTIFLSKLIYDKKPTRFFITFGIYSLEIYLTHTFASAAIRIFQTKYLGSFNIPIHIMFGNIFGLCCPLILVYFVNKFHLAYLFRFKPNTGKPTTRKQRAS